MERRAVEISLVWVPAHVGIATNKKVDKLAKEAAQKETININLSKAEGKSIVWQVGVGIENRFRLRTGSN